MKNWPWGIIILFICVIVVGVIAATNGVDCAESGGQYVRGMFWFECIR